MGDILILLDNQCLSPCYSFAPQDRTVRTMSLQTLHTIVEWMSHFQPSAPGVLCQLGGVSTLDKEILKMLQAVAASLVCAPIAPADQESAGLPVMKTQVIVFPSLRDFETHVDILRGRACVIHIACDEIENLSAVMRRLAPTASGSRLQLRPRNLPLWDRSCFDVYKEQIERVRALQYRLKGEGIAMNWERRFFDRCPALRMIVTIGPDGLCYPCPAFYHAGVTHGLEIGDLARGRVFIPRINGRCRSCQTQHCPGCLFWELGHARGEISPCNIAALNPVQITSPCTDGTVLAKRAWDEIRVVCRRQKAILRSKAVELLKQPALGRKYARLIHSTAIAKVMRPPAAFRNDIEVLQSNEHEAGVYSGLPEIRTYRNVWLIPHLNAAYKESGEIIPLSLMQRGSYLYGTKYDGLVSMIDVHPPANALILEKAMLGGGMCFGHYGHFLLESLSRLWPFAVPDLAQGLSGMRVIYWPFPANTMGSASTVMHATFEGLRITWDCLHITTQPVFVRELTIPEPAVALSLSD